MPSLSEADRRAALKLARDAVVDAVSWRKLPNFIPRDGIFAERRGVFVTLHVRGHLQGCIGVTEASEPLGEAIVRCASSAAVEDPRFAPMNKDQLEHLSVEISLLSALEPIAPETIEIGRHGLLIVLQAHRGLLLPQVAIEHRLTREQFLEEACRKAGLRREAWRDPEARIFGFTCEVLSGDENPAGA
ncbi:MAG TPA: AmmeMemoRadiSam system protein A [Candidatus Acidoferrum sp.]|jgi:AmmeMemoRadiSam system protein A|nr:AmmeMemoRadiSam system protein A [Candidatus Acidoferrum sp.]